MAGAPQSPTFFNLNHSSSAFEYFIYLKLILFNWNINLGREIIRLIFFFKSENTGPDIPKVWALKSFNFSTHELIHLYQIQGVIIKISFRRPKGQNYVFSSQKTDTEEPLDTHLIKSLIEIPKVLFGLFLLSSFF